MNELLDVPDSLGSWKKWHQILNDLRKIYWEVVSKYRREWKTPSEIFKILENKDETSN